VFLYVAILLVAIGFTLRALIRSFSSTATSKQSLASNRALLIVLLLFLLFLVGAALDSGGTSDLEWFIGGAILAILVVPIWALVRTFRLKRTSATHEDVARVAERIFTLETRVKELQQALESLRTSGGPLPEAAKPPVAAREPVQLPAIEKPPAAVTPPVIPSGPKPPAPPFPIPPRAGVPGVLSGAPPVAE